MRRITFAVLGCAGLSHAAAARACDVHFSLTAGLSATSPAGPFTAGGGSFSPTSSSGLSVPVFNSLAGAHAKIYLDFDGDFTANWQGLTPRLTKALVAIRRGASEPRLLAQALPTSQVNARQIFIRLRAAGVAV